MSESGEQQKLLGDRAVQLQQYPEAVKIHVQSHGTAAARSATELGMLTSGAVYLLTSSGLILFNKHALSGFHLQTPTCLLLFHCALAVLVVVAIQRLGLSTQRVEPLQWRLVQIWLPVNVLFVGMISTSFLALGLVGVGMFTVLKNLTSVLTVAGDWIFFGKTYSLVVWLCIMLMVVSAACGGVTDLQFNFAGYTWTLINCSFTAAYTLYLSHAMGKVQHHTLDKQRMNELSMVYYNNILSLPGLALLAAAQGELQRLPSQQHLLRNPEFVCVALVGGLLGCAISFTSLAFMSRSSATAFSLTGSMNKIVVAIAGILLFKEHSSWMNLVSIAVGVVAGTLFVLAKAYMPK